MGSVIFKQLNARLFYLKQPTSQFLCRLESFSREQKGGENAKVLTSRGGGVLPTIPHGKANLPCQAGLMLHSRDLLAAVR
jgi:hypothetical protein